MESASESTVNLRWLIVVVAGLEMNYLFEKNKLTKKN